MSVTLNTDETDFRLPRDVVPTRYELTIAPDLERCDVPRPRADRARRGRGDKLDRLQRRRASDLQRHAEPARRPGSAESISTSRFDEDLERVTFTAPHQVLPGSYVLECDFAGVLNDKLRGFYRSTFRDEDGNEHVIATTQFESTDARRAFPCWDEPDRKAVFSISLEVEADLLAISNGAERRATELPGGKRRLEFTDTIPMSTYLVAFVVGPLEATDAVDVDGTPLRVVHTAGKAAADHVCSRSRRARAALLHRVLRPALPRRQARPRRDPRLRLRRDGEPRLRDLP